MKSITNPRGAGRKKTDPHNKRITISVSLPKWLLDKLTADNRSEYIEQAIIDKLDKSGP